MGLSRRIEQTLKIKYFIPIDHISLFYIAEMSLKWHSEGRNGLNVTKLDSNMRRHSENESEELSNLEERKLQIELSEMEERKLQIDEGNRPKMLEEEDRYQLPDTQNHELSNSENHDVHITSSAQDLNNMHSPIRSAANEGSSMRLSDLPIPLHLQLERQRQEQLVGEPQLHVQEMSSTVSSPGKSCVSGVNIHAPVYISEIFTYRYQLKCHIFLI